MHIPVLKILLYTQLHSLLVVNPKYSSSLFSQISIQNLFI
uniref:Uncharacterized protein n=1 Tax=Siphoviridae sp. ctrpg19 TaxID=2826481 RepID=A0A8S5MK48_9CAUD|nr:MAG TPA: hypothetical protein [Siphoviridae sp. ctrpg19]